MDWSRAKTILIVTFFCLNVFLVYQLIEKRSDSSQLGVMAQPSFQDLLQNQNLEIELSDPSRTPTGYHVTGFPRAFNEEEVKVDYEGQEVEIDRQEYEIVVELEESHRLIPSNLSGSVNAFLGGNLLNGDEYAFGYFNEEEGYIRAFQTHKDELLRYLSGDSHVKLEVNEDMEIERYSQRYLDLTPQLEQEQELISPLQAIEALIEANLVGTDLTIDDDDVELGYYNVYQNEVSAPEFYAPMWRIMLDDRYRYVNALDGDVVRNRND
ncbi:two-component system regulatory protein YycI [Bacillus sp. H-16]|uniref:two-component system regulatory protein YycI n=1 Tax=Alteribacter salitolerans TaxID=2912333 RepID=UPI001966802C|nr:two-component system regulatory protein YycI [Alteribacter salitolerans]MBM7095394.1 two-component system regulatory protein YycI [Alteribacter salitolerans]